MRKGFLSDFFLNSFSHAAGLLVIQMIIYPFLGRQITENEFGDLIFIMAVVNIAGMFIGNSLGLLALRQKPEFTNDEDLYHRISELNFLFWWAVISTSILTIFFLSTYNGYSPTTSFIAAALIIAISSRSYAQVGFRLSLDYNQIFITNILYAFAHALGLMLWFTTKNITALYIFLVGEVITVWYVIAHSSILRLQPLKTENSLKLCREYLLFILSSLTQQLVTYGDRFIIKYTLGIINIPIFFAASINGKILALCASSFSTVSLSHLVHEPTSKIRKKYISILTLSIGAFLVFFAVIELCTPYIIQIFYPKYYDDVMAIHLPVNIAFTLFAFEKTYQSMMIRLVRTESILFFNLSSAIIYFSAGIYGAHEHGMHGFVISFAVVCLIKVVVQQAIIMAAMYSISCKSTL